MIKLLRTLFAIYLVSTLAIAKGVAEELLAKVQTLLGVDEAGNAVVSHPTAQHALRKSLVTRLDEGANLSTTEIVLISIGGVLVVVIGYLIYRYKKWVPKTRSVSRPVSPSGTSSPTGQGLLNPSSPTSPNRK